jgi:hypothetical protein
MTMRMAARTIARPQYLAPFSPVDITLAGTASSSLS